MVIEYKIAHRAFDALSHMARLKIFRLLVKKGSCGLTASQLCEEMDMPPATLSFHMSKLVNGDLIETKKNGRNITYFADYDAVNGLIDFLTEKCCSETPDNCNIKQSSESENISANNS